MISGAMRGNGEGDALARHLMKTENDSVHILPARGLGSTDIRSQIRELVALSLGGRTAEPIYHLHCDPEDAIQDNVGARARWWKLFEAEFGLSTQPFCAVEHVKHGRRHEHRVYSLVRPDGKVVDLRFDFVRREKVSRIVEFEHGVAAVPSKHARLIESRLRAEGRTDVADWLVASGTLESDRPVAALSPQERLIQERTGVRLDDLRASTLAAWQASDDGASFVAALRARGLYLREGRSGAVVVDGIGTAHLATRLVAAAARRADGTRIPAAEVKARLVGLTLQTHGDNHGRQAERAHAGDQGRPQALGGAHLGARPGRDAGGTVAHRDPGGAHGDRGRSDRCSYERALDRIAARPHEARLRARMRFMPLARNRALAGEIDRVRDRTWAWIPGQNLDIWGVPILGAPPPR